MRRIAALILILSLGCSTCFAGSGPDQKHIDKIKKQVSKYLDKGAKVSVETYDQRKMSGVVDVAEADTFMLNVAGQLTTLKYADVKKIKAPMSFATKNLIATAAVLGGLFTVVLVALAHDQ